MLKLLKYEMKNLIKNIAILIAVMFTVLVGTILKFGSNNMKPIIAINSTVIIVAAIIVLIWSISTFSKEFEKDSGYLLFSIPVSSKKIITVKLITALILNIIVAIASIIIVLILVKYGQYGNYVDFSLFLERIKREINFNILFKILIGVVDYFHFLIVVFFSIILSRAILKWKKIRVLVSFLIFYGYMYLNEKVVSLFVGASGNSIKFQTGVNNFDFSAKAASSSYETLIIGTVFNIVMFLAFFFLTSYLIDEKVDI